MNRIIKYLKKSRNAVVFSGAGMSTESGLKDFRSKGGLWFGKNPMVIASVHTLLGAVSGDVDKQKEFISFYANRIQEYNEHRPNQGHYDLARLHRDGYVKAIITQNVDGYHQRASDAVVDKDPDIITLHGNSSTVSCVSCRSKFNSVAYLRNEFKCDKCGGFLRPDIVLFGEMLPSDELDKAYDLAENADLFIVLGSSLSVSPANSLVSAAKSNGAKVVIVNFQSTPYDRIADVVINDRSIVQVMDTLSKGIYS